MIMTANLDQLEREVEHARAQLVTDLSRLRDPETMAVAKEDLLNQARNYKDEAMVRARRATVDTAHALIEEVRLRVERNPTAALVIGAGIAWRLFQRPPIASLLVAAGVASLVNTSKSDDGSPTPTSDALLAARDAVLDRATRISDAVQDTSRHINQQTRRLGDQVRGAATTTGSQIAEATNHAASQAAEATAQALDYASGATDQARDQIRENPVYFGAAALAIGAVLGLAVSRSFAPASE
jgi:ElaB/YqjD/DUF883 family membrane-anchored ribosome-binding protein